MTWDAVEQSTGGATDAACYRLESGSQVLTWTDVLTCWSESPAFVDFFSYTVASVGPESFRWETPGLLSSRLGDPFEFVVVPDGQLAGDPDSESFGQHFVGSDSVVRFNNLGDDAELIVPAPLTGERNDYAHFGSFLRSAPVEQVYELWRTVAQAVSERVSDKPVWLSTAGAGVPWLHVRLDDQPKYYAHRPYRDVPNS